MQQFAQGNQCEFSSYGENQKAYRLRPNSIYQLDLRVYDKRHAPDSTQEVVIRSSSDLLAVSQPFVTGVGGPTDHSALIVCKRTVESTLATLVVDFQAPESTSSGRSGKTLTTPTPPVSVIAAKPRYLLQISPPRSLIFWFCGFVFLGAFLTSASVEFYKDFVCYPERWALASKMLGGISLSAAAYLAFRKLPSGGSGA